MEYIWYIILFPNYGGTDTLHSLMGGGEIIPFSPTWAEFLNNMFIQITNTINHTPETGNNMNHKDTQKL